MHQVQGTYTVLQIIQCPGSTPAEAPGVSKKIRTCTVNSLMVHARRRCAGREVGARDGVTGAANPVQDLSGDLDSLSKQSYHLGVLCELREPGPR
eukprot:COSAG02_NODE_49210_length_328_cov_0.855895_1_plen_94_part_10